MHKQVSSWLKSYLSHTPPELHNSATIAYLGVIDYLQDTNPQIAQCIIQELKDQRSNIKLIASENYSSLAVQFAMGNLLTDKYAEGFAEHRFYAGCDNIDAIEKMGTDLAKKLFGCDHAYLQPHSGIDANLVAFWSILVHRIQNKELENLGKKSIDELTEAEYERIRQLMMNQTIMGMSLNSGGHLTHGYRHNLSAKMMRSVQYDVDPETRLIDYSKLAQQVKEVKPTILLAGYSAYPRLINFAKMREIADSVGAVFMVDMAHFAGLVAGKVFTGEYNPIPYAHIVTTTTHKTLRGPRGGMVLCTEEYKEIINKGCPLVLGGPLPHVLAAKAIALKEANDPSFQVYAHKIVENARSLAEALKSRDAVISTGGTDNHLMVIDVSPYGLTGRQAEQALREAGLTVNRNAIPWDPNGPWYTSGIRIGTAAITTLGMGPSEMREIADLIISLLQATRSANNPKTGQPSKAHYSINLAQLEQIQGRVQDLLGHHPLYPELPSNEALTHKNIFEDVCV
ncbi:MAG: serine hydroxymethyltransferase [Chlamydiales bacterium]|jgi:glycine hydroxymethyltransferase|nr:serine hydroxymethyltransferase [Chlamydiales bacterium]